MFYCRKINHPNSCRPPEGGMSPSQFGPWLWAEPYRKGYSTRSRYANLSSPPHTMVNSSNSGKGVDSQSQALASSTHSETGDPLALWNIRPSNKEVKRGESNPIDIPNNDPASVPSQTLLPLALVDILFAPCKSHLQESKLPSPHFTP